MEVRKLALEINGEIERLSKEKKSLLIAIDGRSASGKSSLARALCETHGYGLVSMDDFFLRSQQRTSERLSEIGGNIDYERFTEEVLLPLSRGKKVSYRPFNCQVMDFDEEKTLDLPGVVIVEGSYSLHPRFQDYYDLKIFLDLEPERQLNRIEKRNPDKFKDFKDKWIPMEEAYFNGFSIRRIADRVYSTDYCLETE
ncbi:MAG: hypothetical protein GX079_04120 [Tissierellia bacterium]|nr:hypothetical protein [Tissierellia bacterium]